MNLAFFAKLRINLLEQIYASIDLTDNINYFTKHNIVTYTPSGKSQCVHLIGSASGNIAEYIYKVEIKTCCVGVEEYIEICRNAAVFENYILACF